MIKIFAMQKTQPQFPNGTLDEMKAYFTQVMGDERKGKEFYIVGRVPAFNVGIGVSSSILGISGLMH